VPEVEAEEERTEEDVHAEHAGQRAGVPRAEVLDHRVAGRPGAGPDPAVPAVEDAAEVERGDALDVVEDEEAEERVERDLKLRVGDVVVLSGEALDVTG
jgi:hypothetical protein